MNGIRCDCTGTGFEGATCQNSANACVGNRCNFGTCVDGALPGAFTCECNEGFTGNFCDVNIDDCTPTSCANGGICTDDVNGFSCDCAGTGFNGPTCEIPDRILAESGEACSVDADCVTPPCVDTFLDTDRDGFALETAAANVQRFCTAAPSGRTARRPVNSSSIDCEEGNANVFPGQRSDFTAAIPGRTTLRFDYDCDGQELSADAALNLVQDCQNEALGACQQRGVWLAAGGAVSGSVGVPACGEEGAFSRCAESATPGSACSAFQGGPLVRPCK